MSDHYQPILDDIQANLNAAGTVEEVLCGQLGIIATLLARQTELLEQLNGNVIDVETAIDKLREERR